MQHKGSFSTRKNSKKQLTSLSLNNFEYNEQIGKVPLPLLPALNKESNDNPIPQSLESEVISPQKTIYNAVLTENFQYMESLLGIEGLNQATRNCLGHSLISCAIQLDKLAVIHYLLQKRIKIPCNNAIDIPALQSKFVLCGDYGSLYRIGQLKINDLDPNNGGAPIHLAVMKNNIDMAKFLLFCRADVNNLDHFGNSALHLAVSCNNDKMVELLLKNNANLEIVNKQNHNVLNLLDTMPPSAKLDLIKQHIQQFPKTFSKQDNFVLEAYEEGKWANDKVLSNDLIAATNRNDIKHVKLLLNPITVKNIIEAFSQAVHIAIENGNLDLVRLFFEKCGNASFFLQVFNESETPISHAIRSNKEDILAFLAEQSFNIAHSTSHNDSDVTVSQIENGEFTDCPEFLRGIILEM